MKINSFLAQFDSIKFMNIYYFIICCIILASVFVTIELLLLSKLAKITTNPIFREVDFKCQVHRAFLIHFGAIDTFDY